MWEVVSGKMRLIQLLWKLRRVKSSRIRSRIRGVGRRKKKSGLEMREQSPCGRVATLAF